MRTATLSLLVCAAACGASLAHVVSEPSTSHSAVVYDCALQEAERLGFDRKQYDKREMRLVVTRTDPEVRRAETTFRRGFDQLTVKVEPGGRAGSSMQVTARSFLEHFDRTGVRLVERRATAGAAEAARLLLESCTGEDAQEAEPAQGG